MRVDGGAEGTTLDHAAPAAPDEAEQRPALVCAFPTPRALPLPEGGILGRRWLAEHGVEDREISTQHLRLFRSGARLHAQDGGSRNGTWIDGRPLASSERTELHEGARLRLGRTLLVFRTAFEGPLEASEPLGRLVAPFGLRGVARRLSGLSRQPPRSVLLEGETGTGKELLARVAAELLGRAKPYVAINVAGLAKGVFESQLFGHVAGAFSDARHAARGVLASHEGGAVLLDELGELPLDLQAKLLRLLEHGEILPVGADRPLAVDVLLLAATNRALDREVAAGAFRADLLARLAPARIALPSLRARSEDVYAVAAALAARSGRGLPPDQVEIEAMERLMGERWPTNVRGLDAALAEIASLDPQPGLRLWSVERVLGGAVASSATLTREGVRSALDAAAGNERQAARRLGISRSRLRRFLGKE